MNLRKLSKRAEIKKLGKITKEAMILIGLFVLIVLLVYISDFMTIGITGYGILNESFGIQPVNESLENLSEKSIPEIIENFSMPVIVPDNLSNISLPENLTELIIIPDNLSNVSIPKVNESNITFPKIVKNISLVEGVRVIDRQGRNVNFTLRKLGRVRSLVFEKIISRLEFNNLENGTIKLDEIKGVIAPENAVFRKVFAVELNEINFSSGYLYANASGSLLYNCRNFDFEIGICLGKWEKIKNLEIGKEYSVELGRGGFAEGYEKINEILINLKDKTGKKIKERKVNISEDVDFSEKGLFGISKVEDNIKIENIKSNLSEINIFIDESNDSLVRTNVIAVNESFEFDNATIRLVKNGDVNKIIYCEDFELVNFSCGDWKKSEINFSELGSSIEFVIQKFSAYAGGFEVSGYSIQADNGPSSILSQPRNFANISTRNVTIICNATDDKNLRNISLYHNISGTFKLNDTWWFGGLDYTSTFNSSVLLYHFNNDSSVGEKYNTSNNGRNVYDYGYGNYGRNNGTVYNGNLNNTVGVNWSATSGKFNGAFIFDGMEDYIKTGTSSSLDPKNITVELWVKFNKLGVGKNNTTWFIGRGGSASSRFQYSHATPGFVLSDVNISGTDRTVSSSSMSLQINRWYHLAWSYDGSDLKIYKDGSLVGSASFPGKITYTTLNQGWDIGAGLYNLAVYTNPLNGSIDEVAIYNRSLSAKEIRQHYMNNPLSNSTSVNWSINVSDGTSALWNCKADDNSTNVQSDWGNSNWTFNIRIPYPNCLNATITGNITIKSNTQINKSLDCDTIIITNNVVVTFASNISNTVVNLTAKNLNISKRAFIKADGTGRIGVSGGDGNGPGGGKSGTNAGKGGGYGGIGGDLDISESSAGGGRVYGSSLAPFDLGSAGGGNGCPQRGASGGGAIFINVSKKFILDGEVSADGNNGLSYGGGCDTRYGTGAGSGGSVYITTNNLTGKGNITAKGGNGVGTTWKSSGGAGGRVVVYYNTSKFSGKNISSVSGGSGYDNGEFGTMAFIDTNLKNIEVYQGFRFQNESRINTSFYNSRYNTLYNFSNLTIYNAPGASGNTSTTSLEINLTKNLIFENSNFSIGKFRLKIYAYKFNLSNSSVSAGNMTLNASYIYIGDGKNRSASINAGINLTAINLTLGGNSFIRGNAKGWEGRTTANGQGLGKGKVGTNSGGGAGYGGFGGRGSDSSGGNVYGSSIRPMALGSSGGANDCVPPNKGGSGGGLVFLNISNSLSIKGTISSDGGGSLSCGGGNALGPGAGSGGSIYIITNKLSGSGNFTARGGNAGGTTSRGGAGGGGKIAVYYNTSTFTGAKNTIVSGGKGYSDSYFGSAIFVNEYLNNLEIYNGFRFKNEKINNTFYSTRYPGLFNATNITIFNAVAVYSEVNVSLNATIINITNVDWKWNVSKPKIRFSYSRWFEDRNTTYQNVFKPIIEKKGYGSIEFLATLSGVGNFSKNTNITNNSIFVNSSYASGFNQSANITMKGLSFTQAIVQMDTNNDGSFATCPNTKCRILSYNSGVGLLRFNVTSFTTFRASENNTAPRVANVFPKNNTKTSVHSLNLTYNVTDGNSGSNGVIDSCYLFFNVSTNIAKFRVNLTNRTGIQKNINQTFNITASHGTYTWFVGCNDTGRLAANSSSFNISIYNTAPTFSGPIPNQSWNEDESKTINLSAYFTDAENDDINWSYINGSRVSVSVNNKTGIATLTPNLNWYGTSSIRFNATDGWDWRASNNVTLTVNAVIDCGDGVCEGSESCSSCVSDCGTCSPPGGGEPLKKTTEEKPGPVSVPSKSVLTEGIGGSVNGSCIILDIQGNELNVCLKDKKPVFELNFELEEPGAEHVEIPVKERNYIALLVVGIIILSLLSLLMLRWLKLLRRKELMERPEIKEVSIVENERREFNFLLQRLYQEINDNRVKRALKCYSALLLLYNDLVKRTKNKNLYEVMLRAYERISKAKRIYDTQKFDLLKYLAYGKIVSRKAKKIKFREERLRLPNFKLLKEKPTSLGKELIQIRNLIKENKYEKASESYSKLFKEHNAERIREHVRAKPIKIERIKPAASVKVKELPGFSEDYHKLHELLRKDKYEEATELYSKIFKEHKIKKIKEYVISKPIKIKNIKPIITKKIKERKIEFNPDYHELHKLLREGDYEKAKRVFAKINKEARRGDLNE